MNIEVMQIDAIRIGERRRKDMGDLSALAASIRVITIGVFS